MMWVEKLDESEANRLFEMSGLYRECQEMRAPADLEKRGERSARGREGESGRITREREAERAEI
eukprot:scaffold23169_cov30-Tisochrysis_lutea.AAC.2